jgi:large subunit ribosomal protein L23
MDKTTILKPRLSEKTYGLSETNNVYVFEVPANTNKHSVARAVSVQYAVTVLNVNITNVKGKAKRTVRKGGRPTMGKRSDVKKAYVTLKEGDKLPIFATEEDEKKADKKAKKEKK